MYQKKLCRLKVCRNIACLLLGGLLLLVGITEARYAYSDNSAEESVIKQIILYGIFLKSNRE